jgi:hypothetical protein
MKIDLVEMSPLKALELLEQNTNNRTLNRRRVLALAEQIKQGEWILDGNPIRLTESGRLLDGQHRLHAIFESDTTVQCYVASGLDEKAELVIDTGRPRHFSEYIRRRGVVNAINVAAVTRLLLSYRAGILPGIEFREFYPSTARMWEFYEKNEHEITEGITAASIVRRHINMAGSVLGAGHVILSGIDSGDCDQFFSQLNKDSTQSNPVMLLSRWADLRTRSATGFTEQRFQMAFLIKAWNKFRMHDEGGQILSWKRTAKFPVPQ